MKNIRINKKIHYFLKNLSKNIPKLCQSGHKSGLSGSNPDMSGFRHKSGHKSGHYPDIRTSRLSGFDDFDPDICPD